MKDRELIRKLSITGKDRVTLYLSQSKVEQVYVQTVAQVTELVRTTNKGGKISGSILGFLGTEITAGGGLEAKVAMNPLLQAIAAEKAAEQAERLVDLTIQQPVDGKLMRYIGPARFTTMTSPLTPDSAAIPQQACDIVSQRKQIQEEIIKWKNKDGGTVVLTFTNGNAVYASIASTESLDVNLFASYFQQPHVGILCRMESTAKHSVTFLDPIWIWHEAP
jgi:hypothetical protein